MFLCAVETTLRQRSPGAPATARFGAVAFVHRFGSTLNSHVHYHVLVTDGVFSASDDGRAEFHPATELADQDFLAMQTKMRQRGLRWLHHHGHLAEVAVHTLDKGDHAGGWSVDGLDRLSKLVTPPRIHKHRYCGVLAPNAKLRKAEDQAASPNPLRRAAARCWALLLVRIYECLPLLCPSCHRPMRIIAFLEDPRVVERILLHIGEPTQTPEVLPARAPPQQELDFVQVPLVEQGESEWPEMDQTAGSTDDTWD